MKITIITVVRNNKGMIMDAIESVRSQTYKNIEYIVVDGASTDGTTEIIKSHLAKICLLYTSPSPRDNRVSRMPSSA